MIDDPTPEEFVKAMRRAKRILEENGEIAWDRRTILYEREARRLGLIESPAIRVIPDPRPIPTE